MLSIVAVESMNLHCAESALSTDVTHRVVIQCSVVQSSPEFRWRRSYWLHLIVGKCREVAHALFNLPVCNDVARVVTRVFLLVVSIDWSGH